MFESTALSEKVEQELVLSGKLSMHESHLSGAAELFELNKSIWYRARRVRREISMFIETFETRKHDRDSQAIHIADANVIQAANTMAAILTLLSSRVPIEPVVYSSFSDLMRTPTKSTSASASELPSLPLLSSPSSSFSASSSSLTEVGEQVSSDQDKSVFLLEKAAADLHESKRIIREDTLSKLVARSQRIREEQRLRYKQYRDGETERYLVQLKQERTAFERAAKARKDALTASINALIDSRSQIHPLLRTLSPSAGPVRSTGSPSQQGSFALLPPATATEDPTETQQQQQQQQQQSQRSPPLAAVSTPPGTPTAASGTSGLSRRQSALAPQRPATTSSGSSSDSVWGVISSFFSQ